MHKSQGLFLATGRKIFQIVFSVLERFSLELLKLINNSLRKYKGN